VSFAASWKLIDSAGAARRGVLSVTHGEIETPNFMPVGTRGTVKGLDSADLERLGVQMVLANTYHLMLRPGAATVANLGGLHGFMSWQRPILTDSGGFQIFSLEPRIAEEGAVFRSTYDGSRVSLRPEDAVEVQEHLGSDIAMVLDVCVGLPAASDVVREGMELSLRWAERSLKAHKRADQALFGIVQGGVDPGLRARSASETAAMGFVGFGIGGLSVGESAEDRGHALDAALPELPATSVRYVMGLGDPEGVLDAISRGADLFDCVWPTRLARHGRILTSDGDYNLRRAEFADDPRPLSESCGCPACAAYSRAYLRHLLGTGELSVLRLLSLHNLTYTLGLLDGARRAVTNGDFESYRRSVVEQRRMTSSPGRNGRRPGHD